MRHLILAIAVLPQAATATHDHAEQACDRAALAAAERHGVPPQVMLAITRVETGQSRNGKITPWPWAINLAGEGHFFDSRAAAEAFATAAASSSPPPQIDLGCFQINLRWHGESFASLGDMLDPEANADHAARFLADLHQRKGSWVSAVAAYHSQDPDLASTYLSRVEAVLQTLDQAVAADPPALNAYPLLRPGPGAGMGSLMPAVARGMPFLSQDP